VLEEGLLGIMWRMMFWNYLSSALIGSAKIQMHVFVVPVEADL
jgi:hypothetical protein